MSSARERARRAVEERFSMPPIPLDEEIADAASDVWESVARTLAAHTTDDRGICRKCHDCWPCTEWLIAEEELDG